MADNLPEPKSRKESYLAKAAGMDVTIPEAPESRTEQYLAAIAEGGGGGGGTSDFNELSNRPKYNGTTMTSSTDIPASPTVVQTTGTSTTDVMSQNATTGMVFADPGTNSKVRIGNTAFLGDNGIVIGKNASGSGGYAVSIGSGTSSSNGPSASISGIAIGRNARQKPGSNSQVGNACITIGDGATTQTQGYGAIALGAFSYATEKGQMDISTLATTNSEGYNNSQYRLLTGLYDGQNAHDAVTLGQLNTRLDNLTLLKISQTDYDNLQNKDANTLYVITGA